AGVYKEVSCSEQESEQARIESQQQIEVSKILQERALDEERIARERQIQQLEIERRKTLELAEQDRAIAIADKSREQSEAQAEADLARAQAVTAEEKVFSAREVEVAERRKHIELIGAAQEVEREAMRVQQLATAEKHAAVDRAAARRTA